MKLADCLTLVRSHGPQAGQLGAALQEQLQPLPQRLLRIAPPKSQNEQLLCVSPLACRGKALLHNEPGLQEYDVRARLVLMYFPSSTYSTASHSQFLGKGVRQSRSCIRWDVLAR